MPDVNDPPEFDEYDDPHPFEPYEYFLGDSVVGYYCHLCCQHGELSRTATWGDVDRAAELHLLDSHGLVSS